MNIFSRYLSYRKNNPLANLLMIYVVLLSLLFIIIVTVFQLYFYYRHEIRTVKSNVTFIKDSYLKPISAGLFNFDKNYLQLQLDGMLKLNGVVHVEITENADGKSYMSAGDLNHSATFNQTFPLVFKNFNGNDYALGYLTVTASLERIYGSLMQRFIFTIFFYGICFFFAAIIMVIVIHYKFTRHLITMAEYTDKLNLDTLGTPLVLNRKDSGKNTADELDRIANGFNAMRNRLIEDIKKQQESENEKKKMEVQLMQAQKMEAIGTLAGGIAHDFNNILGIILGNTELALFDTHLHPEIWESLKESETACLRAKELIKQILNFSRFEQPEKEVLDIVSHVKDSIRLVRATLPATVKMELKPQIISANILGNPIQINQILLNLCTNAAQSMNFEGILDIDINSVFIENEPKKLIKGLSPGYYVVLTVSDTGSGIEPDLIDKIFDPYFTTKDLGKGTGLGLSVVYGIVKAHEGTINVYSEAGSGTTFKIYLPIVEKEVRLSESVSEEAPSGKEHILLVDDESILAGVAEKILHSLGYQVTCHTDPLEALQAFHDHPDIFDLIITDMTMPGLPGDRLAVKALKIRPDIPVVLCTGHSETINSHNAERIGIKKYLTKPLTRLELGKAIREVLDQEKSQDRAIQ
ncbi:MAG: response regulator [Proteobacteria bacterium]|nr:response regulator [Pseudomonadota bacterium]